MGSPHWYLYRWEFPIKCSLCSRFYLVFSLIGFRLSTSRFRCFLFCLVWRRCLWDWQCLRKIKIFIYLYFWFHILLKGYRKIICYVHIVPIVFVSMRGISWLSCDSSSKPNTCIELASKISSSFPFIPLSCTLPSYSWGRVTKFGLHQYNFSFVTSLNICDATKISS